ncbi:cation diffusion facilitator CzcD-associated flavoprotein CzcO [Paraperlucidibaca baekdonensis]|uniref:Cation diffusion facilitator CzcD-associated flavoprotein CzcO n=1 Tax=Paraperlucidibaca baekdonensis TaxID=748120 RepID=A0A3E0H2A5_9GAMM|nr:NAD(P)/FAD-dependent oxidoreductase [Paraperlucidibaca baekdonensis]REH36638.1 cation diffusion facilitator CzcD-associated flavoprotein CzcO [Paraperlucidibaca baekdonensis]
MNAPLTASPVSATTVLDAVIVGAGFSGLGMAIRLKLGGVENFRVFERGHDVGGTWRDNTYPGCGCDVKSALYSYSFEPWAEWSNDYAKQGEIYSYVRHCANKYGMYPFIQFNTAVTGARYDASSGHWQVSLSSGETVTARSLITAPGPFADPKQPDIAGLDSFQGKTLHTARWDKSVDLKGKRVGLIGTGATAVQVGPAIADDVASLTVFQRTANWIMPRMDRDISEEEKAIKRRSPSRMLASRLGVYWFNELTAPFLILRYDLFKSQPQKLATSYLKHKVKDAALRAKLTPNFKFGCKRVLVSSDWYPTMQREHVQLETNGISHICEQGVITADGQLHELDVIILATGYEVRHTGSPVPITGLNNTQLNDKWRDGTEAYQGISTAGFPNLYFLVGPFTGPGHTSVIAYAEAQIDYVYQALKLKAERGIKALSVKPEVEAAFVSSMDSRSEHTVWKSGCASWYLSPNGRNNTLYPGLNAEYRLRIARFNPSDYVLECATDGLRKAGVRDHLHTALTALRG